MAHVFPNAADETEPPIVVIGGGMVGIATAIWLQKSGQRVTLIDKAEPTGRASYGNAGVLASSSVLPVTMPGLLTKLPKMVLNPFEPIFVRWPYLPKLIPWALRYLSHGNEADARRIASAMVPIIGNSLDDHLLLTEGTPAQRHIKPCDFAVLFKDRAQFEGSKLGFDIRRDLGFEWSEHEGAACESYDPLFPKDYGFLAAFGKHGRITDPGAYLDDLHGHFVASGGTTHQAEVTDITHERGQVTGVVTSDGPLAASAVAITAGAWSPLMTKKLGVKIPVEAESGYHLEFWGASCMPKSPTLVPDFKLILSPMEGRLRVAGGVEFGGLKNAGRDVPFAALKYGVDQILPGLTYSKETRWMGHRPAPTDSIPIIDELPNVKGVYLGFGHQHVGLTGSARTGQILANLITGEATNIDLKPYKVTRFMGAKASQSRTAHTYQMEAS
ncbi:MULTISPECIES: NAD(P)/FAD-dependent oxidoreductase [Pacificibacter]|uniref:NAD(P)/FAD-dependent oxidoreductase n=1 Tax=Pacificibacter TaxID=1042323 RepID=UPI001C0A4A36|nr:MULTISPECIES: FAD-binding oxidoreductase [Pacificibacter]MBU2937597.1 FAD-binding oxidoreductase [Pacificibacter marinus]MDO6616892.1 FAD-binding oxidoreductase [Pacificibacter sp. 1_MG-2023]